MDNSDRPAADPDAASILSLVKQVQYKAYVRLEALLQPLGVTAVQFRILTTISSRPDLTSAELARIYDVKPQTMIRQIGALEGRGLVERQEKSDNKRLLELSLTAAGRTCLAQCHQGALALERELLGPLSPAQREELRDSLLKLQQGMSEKPTELEEISREYRRPGIQRL